MRERRAALIGPPDPNYQSREFLLAAGIAAGSECGDSFGEDDRQTALGMLADNFVGALVRVTRGTGATQERPSRRKCDHVDGYSAVGGRAGCD